MTPSDDRLDPTAVYELQCLLSRRYTVRIEPAHGLSGVTVGVFHTKSNNHCLVSEGRSHDLSRAMHRAYLAVEAREQDAGTRK